jgi:cytochrome c biogenesis protein CcmG, thiol:disulfide interchange protein DsbE
MIFSCSSFVLLFSSPIRAIRDDLLFSSLKGDPPMRRLLCVLMGAALLLPAACSQAGQEKPGVGDKLVQVPLTTLDGKETSLAAIVKGHVTAFKFGTTWCGWCNKLLGEFDKAIAVYGDKVVFLDIDVSEPAPLVKSHHEKGGFKTPVVLDPKGKAAETYHAEGFPTFLIADHTGKILLRGYFVPFAKFKPLLDKAVAAAEKAGVKPKTKVEEKAEPPAGKETKEDVQKQIDKGLDDLQKALDK